MTAFLFIFGFGLPPSESGTAFQIDDTRAFFVDAADAGAAHRRGRELADEYVRKYWAVAGVPGYDWKNRWSPSWIETSEQELYRAGRSTLPTVKPGQGPPSEALRAADYPNRPLGSTDLNRVEVIAPAAFRRCADADRLAADGKLDEARTLMQEAAALDRALEIRARFIGQSDPRRIRVTEAIKKILVPFFTDMGFAAPGGGKWKQGDQLERVDQGCHQIATMGREKFGGRLGVSFARYRTPERVEWFDRRTLGLRGSVTYTTQTELEAACALWRELVAQHVVPWWNRCRDSA